VAVRDALLSILLIGPAYGFQLHGELAARTGGRRAINVGQTYATLERLTDRGLIERAGTTDDGLPLHRLTDSGRAAAVAWLRGLDAPVSDPWDETVDRVLVAASLPGFAFEPVVAGERTRWIERRDAARAVADASTRVAAARLEATRPEPPRLGGPLDGPAAALDAARADALLDWLDALAAHPPAPFGLAATRPKRGRRPASPAPHDDTVRSVSAQSISAQSVSAPSVSAQSASA
jgi:DNA-binding PadR family transcriptional regulator